MTGPILTAENNRLVTLLGNFIVVWSVFDTTIDAAITKQLNLDPTRGAIVTSGLGFERKLSILRSLLHLRDPEFTDAVTKLDEIVSCARRNVLLHGHVWIGASNIEFIKVDTDHKVKARKAAYDPLRFAAVLTQICNAIDEVQILLGVSEDERMAICNVGKSLASKSATDGKAQTS